MNETTGGLYRSAYKKAVGSLTAVIALAVLVNLAVGLLVVWPAWKEHRSTAEQVRAKEAEQQALAAKPVVEQATDQQIGHLLTALPLKLQLSAITGELMQLSDRAEVIFVKLSQDAGQTQAAATGTAAGSANAAASAGSADTGSGAAGSGTDSSAAQAAPGTLVPHRFQATVYGDLTSLEAFLQSLADSATLYSVGQFAFAKLEVQEGEGDLSSLLVKLPHWREGLPAYSLNLTLGVFTLPDSYQQAFKDWKPGRTTAMR